MFMRKLFVEIEGLQKLKILGLGIGIHKSIGVSHFRVQKGLRLGHIVFKIGIGTEVSIVIIIIPQFDFADAK